MKHFTFQKRAVVFPASRNWRFRCIKPPIHLLLRELEEEGRQEESVEFMEDRIKYLDSLKISVGGGTIRRACDVFVLSQSWDTTDESPPAVPVSA